MKRQTMHVEFDESEERDGITMDELTDVVRQIVKRNLNRPWKLRRR